MNVGRYDRKHFWLFVTFSLQTSQLFANSLHADSVVSSFLTAEYYRQPLSGPCDLKIKIIQGDF